MRKKVSRKFVPLTL